MADKGRTQAEHIANLEALIGGLKEKIEGLDGRIAEMEDKIAGLKGDVVQLEADAEDGALSRRGAYRALPADLDCLFGIKHLPLARPASLTEFGEML
jgi:hypothetical protein